MANEDIVRELQSMSFGIKIRFNLGPMEVRSSEGSSVVYRVRCHAVMQRETSVLPAQDRAILLEEALPHRVYVAEWAGDGSSWLLVKADELPFGLTWPFDGMPGKNKATEP